MQESTKIIIAVVVGVLSSGILFSIFKFIIINWFKKIGENFKELFESRNEHEVDMKEIRNDLDWVIKLTGIEIPKEKDKD